MQIAVCMHIVQFLHRREQARANCIRPSPSHRPHLPNLFSRPPRRLFTFFERVAASLVAACCWVPPSVSVRSGLFRVANSSWPESLHTVHIITPPMQTRPSIPVIYCRVGGEQTRRQRRDRCAGGRKRRSRGEGGGREAVIEVTVRGGENEEGYFQRTEQVKAQWRHGAALSLGRSLSHVIACHVKVKDFCFSVTLSCFLFYPTTPYFTHIANKRNPPHSSFRSYPWPCLVRKGRKHLRPMVLFF